MRHGFLKRKTSSLLCLLKRVRFRPKYKTTKYNGLEKKSTGIVNQSVDDDSQFTIDKKANSISIQIFVIIFSSH